MIKYEANEAIDIMLSDLQLLALKLTYGNDQLKVVQYWNSCI